MWHLIPTLGKVFAGKNTALEGTRCDVTSVTLVIISLECSILGYCETSEHCRDVLKYYFKNINRFRALKYFKSLNILFPTNPRMIRLSADLHPPGCGCTFRRSDASGFPSESDPIRSDPIR